MNWGSYYLFWLLAPTALAMVSRYPLVMLVVPIGFVARRWLPDPILWLRRAGRISSLHALVRANVADVVSRRQLAMLYLEQRKPLAALPFVDAALEREPQSAELLHLRGLCLLGARRWDDAVASFIQVVERDARFRYGEPYLKIADALFNVDRWKDAEESLEHFLAINGSSLEGWCKLAKARDHLGPFRGPGRRGDEARIQARAVYAQLPRFQRRRQLLWWFRSLL
jgi:tetratricopeptide (TPR) repeat protein